MANKAVKKSTPVDKSAMQKTNYYRIYNHAYGNWEQWQVRDGNLYTIAEQDFGEEPACFKLSEVKEIINGK